MPTSYHQTSPSRRAGRDGAARDALIVVFLAVVLLVLFEGSSVRTAGEEMNPGVERDVVLAVGKPAGWVADRLPFDEWGDDALAFLEDEGVGDEGGFDDGRRSRPGAACRPVSPDSFDPAELGAKPEPPRALDKLLVTGDSLAMPLDVEIARRLAESDDGRRGRARPARGHGHLQERAGRLGQAVDRAGARAPSPTPWWSSSAPTRASRCPGRTAASVECCGPHWAAEFAYRVRRMMNTYRQGGGARVYWLTLPLPRDATRQEVARAVNAAIEVAAAAVPGAGARARHDRALHPRRRATATRWRSTGAGRSCATPTASTSTRRGAELAADVVLAAVRRDFGE